MIQIRTIKFVALWKFALWDGMKGSIRGTKGMLSGIAGSGPLP